MSNLNELKPIINLNPFARFCCTIGNLPSSYMASLTYEEQLMWFCDYLQNTVIPAVNNNAECVKELQELYVKLKNYVDNYFENLDVQNEINNKLDEMAEDGSLTSLIEKFVNPYIEEQNEKIAIQDSKIASLSGQTPIFVDSIEKMTDNSTIYVLSTDSHIYQYSTFTNSFIDSGAIYGNANTFPIGKIIITESNYETLLPDLNGVTQNNVYSLLFAKNATAKPLNLPIEPEGKIETLVVNTTNLSVQQVYYSRYKIFVRTMYNNSGVWENWTYFNNVFNQVIDNNNYSTLLPDLNNVNDNTVYNFLFSSLETNLPLNYPTKGSGGFQTLITYSINKGNSTQLFISKNNMYFRFKYLGNWNSWTSQNGIAFSSNITNTNYSSLLPDLNTIKENSVVYSLLFARGETNKPLNLPVDPSGSIETLLHFEYSHNTKSQLYFTQNNIFYRFCYGNVWRDWQNYTTEFLKNIDVNTNRIIYVGANRDYTTLKSGLEEAIKIPFTTVYVDAGTYDLFEEFGGNDFFNSFTHDSPRGLILSNNIKVIFSSNSKVIFNYSGDNEDVKTYFSPFNSGVNGFELQNLTLYSSGCRYAIHDEKGGSSEHYTNIYKNCYIEHNHNTNGGFLQVIGGGLGANGEIIIKDCIFENESASDTSGIVSYHNDNSSSSVVSKSNLVIKNNYFKNGTFRLSWCGISPLITNCLLANNKLNAQPIHKAESSNYTVENTNLLEINNIC